MKRVHGVILSEKRGLVVGETLVIADLHLGIEGVLEEKGIAVPSLQIDSIISGIEGLVDDFSPEELVIAGDLKHEFSRNVPGEWKDVRKFIESISRKVRLRVVRGNHDNFLQSILSRYGVEFSERIKVGQFSVEHGHRDSDAEKLIMGHEHPSIKLRHEGGIYTYRAFLHAKNSDREVWVLPHFSPILPGSNVLESDFLSPVMKSFSPDMIEVYAVEDDVYFMGTLKILRELM